MRKIVYKSAFIKSIILAIAVLILITIWPLKLYRRDIVYANPPQTQGLSQVINYQNTASQVFIANDDHLQSISILVGEGTYADYFDIELTSSKGKVLATEQWIDMPKQLPAYVDILMDVDLTPQELYTLKISSVQSMYVGQEPWYNPETVAVSYYNDTIMEGMNLVMDYKYREPLTLGQNMLFVGMIVLAVAVSLSLVILVLGKSDRDKAITLEQGMRWLLNPVVAILMLVSLVCIATGKVSEFVPDNVAAVVGVIFFGIIAFYGINHDRSNIPDIVNKEYLKNHLGDFVQSIAIAGAIQSCCQYVAGLYDIHHRVAERKEMLWFALIVIAMFEAKEIFCTYNAIYLAVGAIAGVIYYTNNLAEDMTADDLFVLRASIAIVILTGMIILRTIMAVINKKKIARPNIAYLVVTFIYLMLIIVFRNTRWWTVVLAVAFILLFVTYGFWDKKDRFLDNVIRGVVIQFVLCTIWCWFYRPYSTYCTARFPHYFHTETIAATYLTMVGCVAIVMILVKVIKISGDRSRKQEVTFKYLLQNTWKELLFFGAVMSYLIFTMARTAYFSIIIAVIFAILLILSGCGKQTIKMIVQTVGALVLSVILTLPVAYEIQRTVPCLVSNPVTYDIESFQDEIMRGRQLTALQYMMVGKFANLFCEKILGIEDAGFDDYYDRDYTFDEYNATMLEIEEATGYKWSDYIITDEMWDNKPSEELFEAYLQSYDSYGEEEETVSDVTDVTDGMTTETTTQDNEINQVNPSNRAVNLRVGQVDIGNKPQQPVKLQIKASDSDVVSYSPQHIDNDIADDDGMVNDYTNGRLDIFKSYIEQMNMTGHDTMGALLSDGSIATHAHDVYLQVAYDHGIPTGIVFVIFGIFSFVMAVASFVKNKATEPERALSAVVLVAFAVAGIVEWTYHLSHPMTLVLWLCITPLIYRKADK